MLREWRLDAGLSQEALGERIGARQATVSGIERGEQSASPRQMRAWVEACGGDEGDVLEVLQAASRAPAEAPI